VWFIGFVETTTPIHGLTFHNSRFARRIWTADL